MKNLPQISEAEFEVMKIVWKYAPINTNEITEKLKDAIETQNFVYSQLVPQFSPEEYNSIDNLNMLFNIYFPKVGDRHCEREGQRLKCSYCSHSGRIATAYQCNIYVFRFSIQEQTYV